VGKHKPQISNEYDYSANNKKALTKDIIEGLEKDIERLKRKEENIKRR
jgi:hypothetical protein